SAGRARPAVRSHAKPRTAQCRGDHRQSGCANLWPGPGLAAQSPETPAMLPTRQFRYEASTWHPPVPALFRWPSTRAPWSDRLELRLLLVAERCVKILKRRTHRFDGLQHGVETPDDSLQPRG